MRGQVDTSARVIWLLERLGWATDVRCPKPDRLATKLVKPAPS
jgi:stearoyl-CoA desaturase (delta-9 desaturase)